MRTVSKQISTNSRVIKETLTNYKNTFSAFTELINNSIQASAKKVEISIDYSIDKVTPSPVSSMKIKDDGIGVSASDFDKKILEIGTDVKNGGEGIGRFGALQIGRNIKIETCAYDKQLQKFTKTTLPLDITKINQSKLSQVNIDAFIEELDGSHDTYYQVTIDDLYHNDQSEVSKRNKISEEFLEERIHSSLFEKYILDIFNDKVSFYLNGKYLNPEEFLISLPETIQKSLIDAKGNGHDFIFHFYNVKSHLNKVKVFFYVKNAGLKTVALEFTYSSGWYTPDLGTWFVYVESDLFTPDLFKNLDLDTLGDYEANNVKEFVKSEIDSFFKANNKKFDSFISRLEKDEDYPYSKKAAHSSSQELLFKKVAYLIESQHKLIEKKRKIKNLVFSLIDKALSDGHVEEIFQEILKLSPENIERFKALLDKTDLEDVIHFTSSVANKLEFLDFLHELTYGDISHVLKERSQLHKIIEKELWIFGESYNDTPHLWSDKKIGNILFELRKNYFDYEPDEKDENLIRVEGMENITDLFFFNEKILDSDKKEIMVVELKSPKCKISQKEINQIDKYAYTLETFPGLPKENVKYKFILISSQINGFALSKLKSSRVKYDKPFMYDKKTERDIEVYVMDWSELIEANKRKLGYLSSHLQVKDKTVKAKFEEEYEDIIDVKLDSRLTKTDTSRKIKKKSA